MPDRVDIHSRNRVLDGFFKIEEVQFRHQRTDGRMTLPTMYIMMYIIVQKEGRP
jgi:hypothetical protein